MSVIADAIARKLKDVSGCHTKIQYVDRASAEHSARQMASKTGRRFNTYLCRNCNRWHVGKKLARRFEFLAKPESMI